MIAKRQMQQVKTAITLSYFERLLPICFFNNKPETRKKMIHYHLVKNYIKNQICIKTLITKMNELEKLKHSILNREQLNILDNIDNPPFSILYDKKLDKIDSVWRDIVNPDSIMKKRPFDQLYFNLKKKEPKSDIDNNILNLIEHIDKLLN